MYCSSLKEDLKICFYAEFEIFLGPRIALRVTGFFFQKVAPLSHAPPLTLLYTNLVFRRFDTRLMSIKWFLKKDNNFEDTLFRILAMSQIVAL